jgi:hypothetical protein
VIKNYLPKLKLFNVRIVILIILTASVNLAAQPAKHYTNVMIAGSRLIISSVINI